MVSKEEEPITIIETQMEKPPKISGFDPTP
jgi:hypothetical protein